METEEIPSSVREIDRCNNSRLRARTVAVELILARVIRDAVKNQLGFRVEHGGTVANAYGFPATSEGGAAVARVLWDTEGEVVGVAYCRYGRFPANKLSLRAVSSVLLGEPALYDRRVGDSKRKAAFERLEKSVLKYGDITWRVSKLTGKGEWVGVDRTKAF